MPELMPSVRGGLFVAGGPGSVPVPLSGVSIAADVRGLCARVTVTQRYVNHEAVPIEAVYLFPLDERAAVCGFEALIDGTLVVGEVKERDEAFRMYDDAMAGGHGAYLLDEERPDVFQASVGNLPPGRAAVLKIAYVAELDVEGDSLRFVVPATVSPRYAPAADRVAVGRADADTLNPPREFQVPYGLELSVRVAMPGRVARVSSPSHPIDVALDGDGVTVALAQQDVALDRDFVLALEGAGFDVPLAWMERTDDGTHAIAVGFVPQLPAGVAPSEVVFLVDRSGSMEGSSIAEVRSALQICLRSLVPGCHFNIVGFGSTYSALFGRSLPYEQGTLEQAAAHVDRMEGDMAGTEILPALEFVLGAPSVSELPRQVVVLTDGQVTNTDEVLRLVKAHAGRARVFTFGIGAGASRHLVNGMARAGNGTAEFIAPRERIEPKVARSMARLLTPSLSDLRLDWGGLPARPATSGIPALFAGQRLVQYAFADEVRAATIRLTGRGVNGPVAFEIPLGPGDVTNGSTVATLAARARIRELEESPAWLSARASRQGRARPGPASSEIVTLGVAYGLVSRETSFVAIERRDAPVMGDVQLRRVPIAITSGWGGAGGPRSVSTSDTGVFALDVSAAWELASPAPDSAARRSHAAGGVRALFNRVLGAGDPGAIRMPESRAGATRRSAPAAPREASSRHPYHPHDSMRSSMLRLVALQRADGSWLLDEALAQALGRRLDVLRRELEAFTRVHAGAMPRDVERAWATALAVAWLESRAAALEDEWQALAAKADRWLGAALGGSAEAQTWRRAAESGESGSG